MALICNSFVNICQGPTFLTSLNWKIYNLQFEGLAISSMQFGNRLFTTFDEFQIIKYKL